MCCFSTSARLWALSLARPAGGLEKPDDGRDYYEGVGHVNTKHWDDPVLGSFLLVEKVFPGGPSDIAGLRVGDRIVAAHGVPLTRQWWDENPSHHLPGPAGTTVRVTVMRRQGNGTERRLDITITRGFVLRELLERARGRPSMEEAYREQLGLWSDGLTSSSVRRNMSHE